MIKGPGRRPFGRAWICAGLAATLVLALAGCSGLDAQQTTLCEALVPIVEPSVADITLTRISADAGAVDAGKGKTVAGDRLAIHYRISLAQTPERPRITEVHTLVCTFASGGLETSRFRLRAVETWQGSFSETQLIFLNSRWINDFEAISLAERSLKREGAALPKGFVTLGKPAGYFLQQIVNAGPPTALYALLALAYSLVYGLTNRINLAFGEIGTIGAFGALIGAVAATSVGIPTLSIALPLAVLTAMALAGGCGAVIGRVVFLPLMARASQSLLVATIGLALVIQEFLARAEGVRERWLQPILADAHRLADGPFEVVVTTMQLLVTGGAALVILGMVLALKVSQFGRLWRAVADDRLMARMLGVNVDRVVVASFAIASALAGLGGSILTLHYGGTSFALGATIGLKALVAAIIGGIGSIGGAVIGGIALGLTESLWSAYEPIVWRDGVVYIALVAFLILRPEGVLGTRRALEERAERM